MKILAMEANDVLKRRDVAESFSKICGSALGPGVEVKPDDVLVGARTR
jgi:hypothetical protein